MHGLSLVNRDAGRHLLCSPNSAFRLNSDRRAAAHLQAFPDRDRYFKATFCSPATRTRFRAPFQGQRSWPTYSISTEPLPNALRSDDLECPADLRSPPGVFMPFGIKAFSQFSLLEVHLHKPPDFPSLPVARLHIMKTAADQRSRFATSCEIRCFRESLGTRTIMRRNPSTVK